LLQFEIKNRLAGLVEHLGVLADDSEAEVFAREFESCQLRTQPLREVPDLPVTPLLLQQPVTATAYSGRPIEQAVDIGKPESVK
jgi:hypothetical protein